MYTALRFEIAVGELSLDVEDGALDSGFLALAQVHDLHRVSLPLGPAGIHAHDHLRPILGLGAASTRTDLELRVAEIIGMREERPKTELLQVDADALDFGVELRIHLCVGLRIEQLGEL